MMLGIFKNNNNEDYVYPPGVNVTPLSPELKNYNKLLDSLKLIEKNYHNIPDEIKINNEVIVIDERLRDNSSIQLISKEKGLLLRIEDIQWVGDNRTTKGYVENRYINALTLANMIFERNTGDDGRGFQNDDYWPKYHLTKVINIALLSTVVEDLTIERILTCENQEIRTQLIKKKPAEEMEQYTSCIHQDSRGKLVDIEAQGKELGRYIMVTDSSQEKPVMLRVPKIVSYGEFGDYKIETVQDALAWTFDVIPQEYILEKET